MQNNPLEVSILNKPDTFGPGRKEQIDIVIGNPRDNPVTGTIVHFLGKNLDPIPSSLFVGFLNPDQAQKVSFNVTPREPTKLDIVVDYRNGVNSHSTMIAVPVQFGDSKIQAEPILSNIVVEYKEGHYTLTGDVFNAGLEVANSVVITTGEGGQPVNPYREYVVGSLQPDDFSSFELTFTAENASSVNMVVNYRDVDGNPFVRTTPVTIPAKTTAKEKQPLHKAFFSSIDFQRQYAAGQYRHGVEISGDHRN